MAEGDISKKTVAVLLLLAIALSITGTWVALTMEPAIRVIASDAESGKVSFVVGDLQRGGDLEPVAEGSKVSLKVLS